MLNTTNTKLTPKKQRLLNPPCYANTKYLDVQKHWRKLGPIFHCPRAACIWLPCMIEYWQVRAHDNHYKYNPPRIEPYCPSVFDSCDWRFNRSKPGRAPEFWDFVCHGACHWIVDLDLFVAINAYPSVPWQILSSNRHSTVWNGDYHNPVLFDINYLALEVAPAEALRLAWPGMLLKPWCYLKPYNHPGVDYGANPFPPKPTSSNGPHTRAAACSTNGTPPADLRAC